MTESAPLSDSPLEHCVLAIDASGLIRVFSPEAEQLFGISAAEVIGTLTCAALGERLAGQRVDVQRLERVTRINRALVAVLSHDLRTPLTGIQGFSEMIRDEDWEMSDVKEFAADINQAAQRMDQMITEMLETSRGA